MKNPKRTFCKGFSSACQLWRDLYYNDVTVTSFITSNTAKLPLKASGKQVLSYVDRRS